MRSVENEMASRCLSVNNIRTASLVFVTTVTISLLVLMINEQDKVKTCTEIAISKKGQEQLVDPPLHLTEQSNKNATKERVVGWDYNWDRMQFQTKADIQNTGVRSILLVRHGQYNFETGELTELGRRQANATGKRLFDLNMKYKVIVHSTMIRARQTAEIIHYNLPKLPLVPDDVIQEGGPIPPEPTVNYWSLPDRAYFVDGPRLESAFRKYFHRAPLNQQDQSFEILIGHANIFKYFALRALQLPPEAWMRVFIAHASITLLHLNPDGTVTMSRLGDSGHFIPSMVTY